MKHIDADATIDAYSLAIQVIGNAFIARREMFGIEAGEFIDCVFSDASRALRDHPDGGLVAGRKALGTAAASVVESLRPKLQRWSVQVQSA